MSGADVAFMQYFIGSAITIVTALVSALAILYRDHKSDRKEWKEILLNNIEHRQKMADKITDVVENNSVVLREVVVAMDHQRSALDKIEKLIIDRIK
jgi:hypothetical protein